MQRLISWFSCGAASAVATHLEPTAIVVRIAIDNEDEDNGRFASDCAHWFDRPIQIIRSTDYADCWDVWQRERYLNGPRGARCTTELKKRVRLAFSKPSDRHIFGFTIDEKDRAERFIEHNIGIDVVFPLIDHRLTKRDCFAIVAEQGIELPAMYRMGYSNANCIGCVKGGRGYWNKIRRDFPTVFGRMAALEREIGASCINGVYLDELPPNAGRHESIDLPDCGLFCGQNLWF